MFEDYYFDDPALQDALAAAGYYTDPARAPAVMPSTVQAAEPIMGIGSPAVAAPYDISGLNLSGLGGFGGGRMGGVLQNDPNQQYITAPISNKGNPTGKMGGNVFVMTPDQPVRLVDLNTKTILFEGTGYDAGKKATELGQNLTDTMGRKASYDIQTADPSGKYTTVANEKFNKSTLGTIGEIAGTLAPIAASFIIPGLGLTTLGSIGASAGVGGLSAALKGDNILKGAALGGLSAAGGEYLGGPLSKIGASNIGLRAGTAIGTGLGSTAGGLLTGQSLKNSLLGGVASGAMSYLSPDISRELGIGGGGGGGGGSDGGEAFYGGPNADIIVNATPFSTQNLKLGGFKTPAEKYLAEAAAGNTIDLATGLPYTGDYSGDLINVIGQRPGVGIGGANVGNLSPEVLRAIGEPQPIVGEEDIIKVTGRRPIPVTSGLNLGDLSPEILRAIGESEPTEGVEEIDVLGNRIQRGAGNINVSPEVLAGIAEFAKNPIIAEATKIEQPTNAAPVTGALDTDIVVNALGKEKGLPEGSVVAGLPIMGLPKMDPSLTEKTTLEKIKDAANLANAVSVLVPLAGGVLGGGGGGGTLSPDTSGLNFTTNPLRPTTPGTGIGGIGGRYPYTPTTYGRAGGDQETEYMFFTRDPVTGAPVAPVTAPATAPAGPPGKKEGGEIDDDMVKHLIDYHKNGGHQGPGQVKGIGSGQEDKIPAYLSDGEYVWSAQDVSDLGDGSNREGVRRLDKMRQMVRQQAGRKDVKKIAKPQKGIDRMLKAVGGMA